MLKMFLGISSPFTHLHDRATVEEVLRRVKLGRAGSKGYNIAMKLTLAVTLFLSFCFPLLADDAEMVVAPKPEQIEVLVGKKQFGPALSLLRRVARAERNASWEKLVEKAAVGQLVGMAKETPQGSSGYALSLKKEFPFLRQSQAYTRLTEELCLTDLRFCFSNRQDGTECAEKLFRALQESSEPMSFYVAIAQLVSGGAGVGPALPFLELGEQRAVGNEKGCSLKDEQSLVLLGLGLPPGEGRKKAQALVLGPCAAKMKPLLQHAKGNSGHLKESLCEINLCPKG